MDNLKAKYLSNFKYYDTYIFICLIMSFLFTTFFFLKAGYIPLFEKNPEIARVEAMKGAGFIHRFSYLSLHFAAIFSVISYNYWPRNKFKLIFLVIILLAFYNMLTGPRSYALYTFLYLFFTFQFCKYGTIKILKAVYLGTILLAIVALVGGLRYSGYSNINYNDTLIIFVNRIYMNPVNADRIYNHYKTESIQKNSFLIDLAVLLPGNQPDLGTYLKNEFGIDFEGGGITVPLPAEGFMNYKYIGVVVYSILFALILKSFELVLMFNKRYPLLLILLLIFPLQWMGVITMGISGIFVKTITPTLFVFIFSIVVLEIYKAIIHSCKGYNT